jgi:hypothetical protein
MGGLNKTGVNTAHDAALLQAEVVRQSAIVGVASSPSGQAVMSAAELAWARSCIASCRANNSGIGQEPYIQVLKSLGVTS